MLTEAPSPGEGEPEPPSSKGWSPRSQIAFVGVAMPALVFLLVVAPYLLSHYVVNSHYRFNYIPPPLGGDRALEGHWTDAPIVAVRRMNFGAGWSAFGWIAPDDDLTTNVLPTVSGTVSQVYASVGQAVAKDAPLFAIRAETARADSPNASPLAQETFVNAPAAGVVTRLDVAIDQPVKNTKEGATPSAASIADLSSVWLVAEVDQGNAPPMRSGQAVEVRPTAIAGRVFNGKLLTVSPVDPETMRAAVRILVENTDGALKLNMLAEFNLSNADDTETLAVPEGAVLFENGATRVFVAVANDKDSRAAFKLTPREVRIGRIRDGMVEVVDGLALGDNVEASDTLFMDRAAKGY